MPYFLAYNLEKVVNLGNILPDNLKDFTTSSNFQSCTKGSTSIFFDNEHPNCEEEVFNVGLPLPFGKRIYKKPVLIFHKHNSVWRPFQISRKTKDFTSLQAHVNEDQEEAYEESDVESEKSIDSEDKENEESDISLSDEGFDETV